MNFIIKKHDFYKPAKGMLFMCNLGKEKGSLQGGYRPVMVVQDAGLGPKSTTVMVAAVTSVIKCVGLSTHVILPPTLKLSKKSMVMMEQIRLVNISDLGPYIDHVKDPNTRRRIDNALKAAFGLDKLESKLPKDAICLCNRCADFYYDSPHYEIKRIFITEPVTDCCSICGFRRAYGFMLFEKTSGKCM